MKSPLSIWRGMTRAEQVVVVSAAIALVATAALAVVGLTKRPGDIHNADAAFSREEGAGKSKKPPVQKDRTVDWPRFGYDPGRSKFLDAQSVKPPFRKVWKYHGPQLIELPPIVVDGRVYFIDNDGLYVALDAETGKVLWKKRLASLNASSPAYENGVLYSVSLEPMQALAVRARDGKVLWRKPLDSRAESSPLVMRGRMYFGDEGGQLYSLRTKDGSTDWVTSLTGSVKAAPAIDDGVLYVGDYGGTMNAVRASDGNIEWQTRDLGTGLGSGRFYSTAAVAFGRVYAGDVDNKVYSFDEKSGDIAWTFSAGNYVYSGIAAADTGSTKPAVYFGSHDRNAYAVDAKSGDEIWQASAGGQVSGPATVIGDVMYLSTFSGNATVGFDLSSGRRVFSYDDGEYGPVVSDGQKLYLTGGVTVTAFQRVDLGGRSYKTKKGQKGIVPPAERRRILAQMKGDGGGAKPKGEGNEGGKQSAGNKGGGNKPKG
jgi:outer membrane protein assembly factor BamB